jgi:anti-sigma regulatory factor (Ser/Thr protein kinase)
MPKKPEIKSAEIKVDAVTGNLGLIRRFIGDNMKNLGFPRKKISALAVSVTEHCENLIRHAYAEKTGKVALKLELKYPEAKIIARDAGPGFNMKEQKIPDTSQRIKKGLGGKMGIKTILALCDNVEYKRIKDRNENTFIVRAKSLRKGKK